VQTSISYEKKDPNSSLVKKVVAENFVSFEKYFALEQKVLPHYIKNEFTSFLNCGLYSLGFLKFHCSNCNNNFLLPFSCKKRGICSSCGGRRMSQIAAHLRDFVFPQTAVRQWVLSLPFPLRYHLSFDNNTLSTLLRIYVRAVSSFYKSKAKKKGTKNPKTGAITFIQRFGGSLNLNIHFHTLFLDGAYFKNKKSIIFKKIKPPSTNEVREINLKIKKRFIRALRKKELIEDYEEGNTQFIFPEVNPILEKGHASSIQKKIAWGTRKGKKVLLVGKLYDLPWEEFSGKRSSYIDGLSLHANVAIGKKNREGIERLCRYTARPAIAESRLTKDSEGSILYELKKPYRDGTTHLKFSQLEFMEKIMCLIPPPRHHLIRFHGVLAPNNSWRSSIVPKKKIRKKTGQNVYWIPWAELLKRTFEVDSLSCKKCNHAMKIVAVILETKIIQKIIKSLGIKEEILGTGNLSRGPPQKESGYFDESHEFEYQNEYDDCFDVDYSDQF
tara:strand:- start:1453 stop:2949 length:1497 start_codon:yes stop_codon:yes gene_type:complete